MTNIRLLIGAGGTGGHLMPALAVAKAFKALGPEADILFVGAGRPAEALILDPEGWPRVVLVGRGFKGGTISGKIRAGYQAVVAFGQALRLINRFRPHLFFGVGGYVSGPVGLASWITGRPVVLHEQNSRPGLANRLLGKVAKEIFLGFPEAARVFPAKKTVFTGNPLRPTITALMDHKINYQPGQRLVLLVMGGSQGASRINLAAMDLAAKLLKEHRDFEIIHQTGVNDGELIGSYYDRLHIKHETAPFFQDPERLYKKAHLGLMRAGALTVSELAAVGLPAILVPLSTAADNHQLVNAQSLVEAGGARVLLEDELEGLMSVVRDFMDHPQKLNRMSGCARNLVNPHADRQMAERLLSWIN